MTDYGATDPFKASDPEKAKQKRIQFLDKARKTMDARKNKVELDPDDNHADQEPGADIHE